MNIFVGNLAFAATGEDVRRVFEAFGLVDKVGIKKKSGQNSRGFGFVSMPDDAQAEAAIAALEGKEFMGRPMSVTVARVKEPKPKKDYKEIKRLRQEAKADGLIAKLSTTVVEVVKPIVPKEEVKVKKIIKDDYKKKTNAASGSKAWIKRKGTGKAKPWKKNPGGIKKKFRAEK